jgi:HTH-type transcriptional regulator/antitoxin HipB
MEVAVEVTTVHDLQTLVRGRRTVLKKTQGALGREAGVSRKWVSDFERGVSISVELPQLLKVLAALDLVVEVKSDPASSSSPAGLDRGADDLDDILERYTSRND